MFFLDYVDPKKQRPNEDSKNTRTYRLDSLFFRKNSPCRTVQLLASPHHAFFFKLRPLYLLAVHLVRVKRWAELKTAFSSTYTCGTM